LRISGLITESSERPLGIRLDYVLKAEELSALKVLAEFDLSRIGERLVADAAMPSSWVAEAILEFRRYLGLHIVSDQPFPMFSRYVDEVWHRCLLYSRLYAELCSEVFGGFLHHEPALDGYGQGGDEWTRFRTSYEELYGPLGRFWLMGRSTG
jgi:hypothetical protein